MVPPVKCSCWNTSLLACNYLIPNSHGITLQEGCKIKRRKRRKKSKQALQAITTPGSNASDKVPRGPCTTAFWKDKAAMQESFPERHVRAMVMTCSACLFASISPFCLLLGKCSNVLLAHLHPNPAHQHAMLTIASMPVPNLEAESAMSHAWPSSNVIIS